jgi:spermidine/putrescine transport system permease protein
VPRAKGPPAGARRSAAKFMGGRNLGILYSGTMAAWFTIFFLAPLLIIVACSFMKRDLRGNGILGTFSLEAYQALGNPNFGIITIRTIGVSLASTLLIILIALPCGYYIARSKRQTLLLLLIIIPFWTNFLIRVFAWMNILGSAGFVNELLLRLGAVKEAVVFMYNQRAVVLVLVYMYLPYAILPLFSTIDKFDFSLLEAARDLGASNLTAMVKVLLPNIRSGIYTAVLFTFIPILGAYAIPVLVGGKDSYMLGNVVADQLTRARNWPLASAISMILTLVTTLGILLMMGLQRRDAARIAGSSRKRGPQDEA